MTREERQAEDAPVIARLNRGLPVYMPSGRLTVCRETVRMGPRFKFHQYAITCRNGRRIVRYTAESAADSANRMRRYEEARASELKRAA